LRGRDQIGQPASHNLVTRLTLSGLSGVMGQENEFRTGGLSDPA
jgi:hypothetical protein